MPTGKRGQLEITADKEFQVIDLRIGKFPLETQNKPSTHYSHTCAFTSMYKHTRALHISQSHKRAAWRWQVVETMLLGWERVNVSTQPGDLPDTEEWLTVTRQLLKTPPLFKFSIFASIPLTPITNIVTIICLSRLETQNINQVIFPGELGWEPRPSARSSNVLHWPQAEQAIQETLQAPDTQGP